MNNINLSDMKKNALLQMAGKKLGTDPETLKKSLETGSVDQLIGSLDPKTAQQVNALISTPGALESLLASEQVKKLLGK